MNRPESVVKAEALREAAADFRIAASAGLVPSLNLAAARVLERRARYIEAEPTLIDFVRAPMVQRDRSLTMDEFKELTEGPR